MSDKTNLFRETIEELKSYGKTLENIVWVGSADGKWFIPLSDLKTVFDIDYDAGYGAQEIADDLVVVGNGWWLERHEYDGAESWHFKTGPVLSESPKTIKRVGKGMWDSVEELNGGGDQS